MGNLSALCWLPCIILALVMQLGPHALQGAAPNPAVGASRPVMNGTQHVRNLGRNSNKTGNHGKAALGPHAFAPQKIPTVNVPGQDDIDVKEFNRDTKQKTGLHTHDTGSVYTQHF
ncbi:hypothetical protein RvY_09791 [Ramazzottius varieornatus]|uniref:Attacin C-terminal domain-containing protein n=1 Tax=Ramazzottius varieornatus TaxID=947166 RepID=A0A1D1VFZ1_RAMVA|nr:hypothetical protein RvY_09791 [Ramazzottius varieornatus]